MEKHVAENINSEIDTKDTFFKYALDGIATSAFGIDINTFEEPNNIFCKMVKEIQRTPDSESGSAFGMLKIMLPFFIPIFGKLYTVENIREDVKKNCRRESGKYRVSHYRCP